MITTDKNWRDRKCVPLIKTFLEKDESRIFATSLISLCLTKRN